ncbi:MAG: glycerol-3-phosphate responsive antiterminator [Thermaerobacter sp.]|nr:glycerol-3-phosphate responsive antiterminator [Thermaerobacter sp.]
MTQAAFRFPRIIPALRGLDNWEHLLDQDAQGAIFILGGTINTIAEPVGRLQLRGWHVFLHVDLLRGLSADGDGMRFLAEYVGPAGIISTHSQTVQAARKVGIRAVQRMFLVDSQSVATGIAQVQASHPDAVEVMPALVAETIRVVAQKVPCPVIAGGLLRTPLQIRTALEAGASSVSTSNVDLWPWATGGPR